MATARQYWNGLKTVRDAVALRLGVDIPGSNVGIRAASGGDLAALAVVLKVLTDKGLVSDAEWQAAQAAALAEIWDREPD